MIILIDVKECGTEQDNCDQICSSNTDGWYNCSCIEGYTLDNDGYTCNGGSFEREKESVCV